MTERSISTLNTNIDADIADNSAGDISALDVRAILKDLADSAWNKTDYADVLHADTDDTLTAGFAATGSSDGTKTTGTYTPAAAGGNYKEIINGGSFTLAPMSLEGNVTIEMTNNGSAGTVTTSGFDIVTGDSLTTTDTHVFLLYLTVIDASSHLHITALQ